jgi:hypothetical protein
MNTPPVLSSHGAQQCKAGSLALAFTDDVALSNRQKAFCGKTQGDWADY